jgi:hypothetical protein
VYENQGKDKEVRTMWKEKGQNIIEYALMLALVVGIGSFIYTQGSMLPLPPFSCKQSKGLRRNTIHFF